MTDWTWVDNGSQLDDLVAQWLALDTLILDTEFVRRRTYYAGLGLIQVSAGDQYFLIDPLAIERLGDRLRPVLTDPGIEKVLHSGEEDLEILGLLMGEPVQGAVDTQLGWGFCGGEASVGYARLMSEQLGVHVPKGQSQSDWLARPLTDEQCRYAVDDVVHLSRFYPSLREQLVANGRLDWVREDMARQARKVLDRRDDDYYLNLRQAWQLKGNRLWLLQQLAAQREQRCQALDVNRKALVSDQDLITLAEKRPADSQAIDRLTDIRPSVLRREGPWILALIAESHTVSRESYPARIQGPLPKEWSDDFQSIRAHLSQIAAEEGIPREYLARKKDLEAFVCQAHEGDLDTIPTAWEGWRWALFGRRLQDVLRARLPAGVQS